MRATSVLALIAVCLMANTIQAAPAHGLATKDVVSSNNGTAPAHGNPHVNVTNVKKAVTSKLSSTQASDAKLTAYTQTIQADLAKLKNATAVALNYGQLVALQNDVAQIQNIVAKTATALNVDQVATVLTGTVAGVKEGVDTILTSAITGVKGTVKVVTIDVAALLVTVEADVEKILAVVISEVAKVNVAGHLAPIVNSLEKILKDAKILN